MFESKAIRHMWRAANGLDNADLKIGCLRYRAFHRFGKATFPDGGSILGLSQFSVLTQLPPKTMLGLKRSKLTQK